MTIVQSDTTTTVQLLQSELSSYVDKVVQVAGFYYLGDKCLGKYLVKTISGTENWGTPFTIDGITLTLSSAGELKVGASYKLIPLSKDGSLNLRLLGLSEKSGVDNAPILTVGMTAFTDVTINGNFTTRSVKVVKNNATYRGSFELKSLDMNQEYILWVKGRNLKFLGQMKFNANNRRCKNGFIGEDWAGSYIQDIFLDSFTYWGMIGKFPYPSNSDAITIGRSQTNRCGSYLDTTFTTLSQNGNTATIKLANPLPSDVNVTRLYSLVAKVNQKQVGSINAGDKILTVVDKTGIRKSENLNINGENDSRGIPIKFKVTEIKNNNIYLDKVPSKTYNNADIYLEDHYLPLSIGNGLNFQPSVIDPYTIKVDCMQFKGMGTSPQGKIRVIYGGGIHIEPGNDNNIWDFGVCHNVANPGISFAQGAMYGHSFQRFESTVCEIGIFTRGGYSSTYGAPYFESNGRNIVVAGTGNFSIYEPVMAEKDIYYCYSDKVDPPTNGVLIVNNGVVYGNEFQYYPFMWPNDTPIITGGRTHFINYGRPSTDSTTFILQSYTNTPSGRVVRILVGQDYKSTITFKSDDPSYTIGGNTTYVDLSGCEITAYKDNISFQWKLFINKTSLSIPAEDSTPPTVTISPPDGSTFNTATTRIYLRPSEHATIYYTLDGSIPTKSSAVYSGPIIISNTTTIRYFAIDLKGNSSTVGTAIITKTA